MNAPSEGLPDADIEDNRIITPPGVQRVGDIDPDRSNRRVIQKPDPRAQSRISPGRDWSRAGKGATNIEERRHADRVGDLDPSFNLRIEAAEAADGIAEGR